MTHALRDEPSLPQRGVRPTPLQAKGLLLLAALAWGMGNVAQKTILDHLDAYAANGITCCVGALILWPLAARETRLSTRATTGDWPLLLLVAASFTLAATLMQLGYGHTTVTNAGFLVNTAAVLTPILAWLLFRQRSPFMIWPASLCALSGVYLMGGGRFSALSHGDLLCLAAALAFAIWTLLVGRYVMQYRRPIRLTVVQLAGCGVVCIVLGGLIHGLPTGTALLAALPEILILGGLSKGLAYVLMACAQQHVAPSTAAVIVSAESVFGAIGAILLLDETLGLMRAIGALCIIGAVVLASRLPMPDQTAPHPVKAPRRWLGIVS